MSVAGVISLTIQSAYIRPWNTCTLLRSPNPFVSISINDGAEVGKTGNRLHDFNPSWMETSFVVVRSLDDTLTLSLFDHHDHRKHSLLGICCYKLSKLKEDAVRGGLLLSLCKNEKTCGELLIDLIYYPLLQTNDSLKDFPAGVISLSLPQARNLDASRSRSGHLSPLAKVYIEYHDSDVPILVTKRQRHSLNPVWQAEHDFYCSRKEACIITVQVIDDHLDDPVVGRLSLRLDDLLDGNESGVEWWPMTGCKTGNVMIRAVWRPLNMHSY
ncbi:hypothetical protein L208DRAFT_1304780 [Tricholoma matsutake]|nr:hypothetical protein L208DRAFT_1304780 [Tricholoma matsutake 945]